MKTYLAGVLTPIALFYAWKYRAVLLPWLKKQEQSAVAAIEKKGSDGQ